MNKKLKLIFSVASSSFVFPLLATACKFEKHFDYRESKYAETTELANDPNLISTIDLDIPNYYDKAIISPIDDIENINWRDDKKTRDSKILNLYKTKNEFLDHLKDKSLFYSKDKYNQNLEKWFDDFQVWSDKNIDFTKYDVLELVVTKDRLREWAYLKLIWGKDKNYLIYSASPPYSYLYQPKIDINKLHYFIFIDKEKQLEVNNIQILDSSYISRKMWDKRREKVLQVQEKDYRFKKLP
ncbi:hypothetical protein MCSF7_02796 [Mycoplasmopsis columbina SF7]|uniref:Lipoprotein n=1 Tax=Mycoplasmopsis columbina SF7 TaxID=1037410 RepID=F9UJA1_9BACT|nr:hypothetical protein [Mycoplasmopsis columbina]EGV00544.1 hypothetical protein MCSF7_02796 [Mycoplasmopsis columbina SF7]